MAMFRAASATQTHATRRSVAANVAADRSTSRRTNGAHTTMNRPHEVMLTMGSGTRRACSGMSRPVTEKAASHRHRTVAVDGDDAPAVPPDAPEHHQGQSRATGWFGTENRCSRTHIVNRPATQRAVATSA
jgi:hypothetical protein